MRITVYGQHDHKYISRVEIWGDYLDAEDIFIYPDGSVTLTCKDGYICEKYTPTKEQLDKAEECKDYISAEDYAEWCGQGWLYE